MINYHRLTEQLISDLALDLAYAIGDKFGEQFQIWQKGNQATSTNAKVEVCHIFELTNCFQGSTLCKNLGVQLW